MPTWIFVRHGQSVANAEGWLAGHLDTPLTPLGVEQARALHVRLRTTDFDRCVSSDLVRAVDTAAAVLQGRALPWLRVRALRERDAGAWERRRVAELERDGDLPVLHAFDGRPPGGESLRDVATRALGALAGLETAAATLVVAHGALMRAVLGVIDGRPSEDIGLWKPDNCEVAVREAS